MTEGQARCFANEQSRNPNLTLEAFLEKERRVAEKMARRAEIEALRLQQIKLEKRAAKMRRRIGERTLYSRHDTTSPPVDDVRISNGTPSCGYHPQHPRGRAEVAQHKTRRPFGEPASLAQPLSSELTRPIEWAERGDA